ncbi:MAG: M23 family metallopeptidase [Fibrobacteria bacterium]|nr:M23 family metallopeptidase [Fibrobacteria bacterium]
MRGGELSLRFGDLGRSIHFRVPRRALHVASALAFVLAGLFGVLLWQIGTAVRIYPDLLLQSRRNASLHKDLEVLAARKESLSRTVETEERVTQRLLSRFGLVEAPRAQTGLPSGGRLLEILFPESSDEGRLAADSWMLGERASRRATELRAATAVANQRLVALAKIPTIAPARGDFVSGFGWRFHPVLSKYAMHEGQDIANRTGTPIHASANGRVVTAQFNPSFGNHVVLEHSKGLRTLYAHMSAFRCKVGDQVQRGQLIGLMGNTGRSTGSHVHYEVHKGDTPVDPMNWILPVTLVP